jgi:hypothetical protein
MFKAVFQLIFLHPLKLIFKVLTLHLLVTSLIACSGSGSGEKEETSHEINALFVKSRVEAGECLLFTINKDGLKDPESIAGGISHAGEISFGNVTYTGNVLIECIGGTYLDEATGSVFEAPLMRSVVSISESASFTVSPITEIATQLAESKGDLTLALSQFNQELASAFGLVGNITELIPTDLLRGSASNDQEGHYAAALTLISQLDANQKNGLNEVISHLLEGFENGQLSAQALIDLSVAEADILEGSTIATANINALILDTITSAAGIPPPNHVPIFVSNNYIEVTEGNLITVYTALAEDADYDAVTYQITGGEDAGLFELDTEDGRLVFTSVLDYENPLDANADNTYEIIISASDKHGSSISMSLSIAILNLNDAPEFTSNTVIELLENQIGSFYQTDVIDPEGDTLSFSITGGDDQAMFIIGEVSGSLSFRDIPDYEAPSDNDLDNIYELELTVLDGNGGQDSINVRVTLLNINEAPLFLSSSFVQVVENSPVTGHIVLAQDQDQDQEQELVSYHISGGEDQNKFLIDSLTGEILFKVAPDYEAPSDNNLDNTYKLFVTATDASHSASTLMLNILVSNVNETPSFVGVETEFGVPENQLRTPYIASAIDPDNDVISYSILGGDDQDIFLIDSNSGILSFRFAPDVENPEDQNSDNTYLVEIGASDGNGAQASQSISLVVQNNIDEDMDGVPDLIDAYPNDQSCFILEDGDGTDCYLSLLFNQGIEGVEYGSDGVLYFELSSQSKILRLNSVTGNFLPALSFDASQTLISFAVSDVHDRLYLGYQNGAITYKALLTGAAEQAFGNTSSDVSGLVAVGNFLLAHGASYQSSRILFDINGVQTDSTTNGYTYSRDHVWSSLTNRVYHFRDGSSPNDLLYQQIDSSQGLFISGGDSPYHGDYSIVLPIKVSPDGSEILLGSGDFYDANSLMVTRSIGSISDASWTASGELLSISSNGSNTILRRRNQDLQINEQAFFEGTPLRISGDGNTFSVLTATSSGFKIHAYTPNNDSDGDGIENALDDYPTDPAASLDSDQDGYPDEWNDGNEQTDSTTALNLDYFPDNAACWSASHADESNNCNVLATMPPYTPDDFLSDNDGLIYFYEDSLGLVYRWSPALQEYLEPFSVGNSSSYEPAQPAQMTLSQTQNRLYFGYSTGTITYIDLSAESEERAFTRFASSITHLVAADDYLYVEVQRERDYYILDASGVVTDSGSAWSNREIYWNSELDTLFFIESGSRIYAWQINQATGEVAAIVSKYHSGSNLGRKIIFSNNNIFLITENGDIFETENLIWVGSVNNADSYLWTSGNELISADQVGSTFTLLRYSSEYEVVERLIFQGTLQNLVRVNDSVFVIRRFDDQFIFEEYIPSDDSDNDGVVNTEDGFPLDPAAALDSDLDGYPDEWNAGYDESDSSTGLSLDSFPLEIVCWLESHDDGSGNCDFSATMPVFTPDQTVVDIDGVIYLFNAENGKVYRWSTLLERYLSPIYLDASSNIRDSYPLKMALSVPHNRLYFGYDSGLITFIDLSSEPQEQIFANVPERVNGLVAVGNFILAQDASGAWNTHYIFNQDGILTDSEDWNYRSLEYAWNSVNNRVYFFRDGTSPNDLHYEEIDQFTGLIMSDGESPYHGARTGYPIRVVANGQYVLLGSGVLYDAESLSEVHDLEFSFSDAAVFSGLIAIARLEAQNWRVELIDDENFELQTDFSFESEIHSIHALESSLIMVQLTSEGFEFSNVNLGDNDLDILPAWWESKYGLSDDDDSDASLDLDEDGVSNLNEFINGTNPTHQDTDNDGLSDYVEIYVHQTSPISIDSDEDGLSDSDEILIHLTDPMLVDSDEDDFSDGDEVIKYSTDPNDSASVPQALTSLVEGFEADSVPLTWLSTDLSENNWQLTDSEFSQGTQSLRSGQISHNEMSVVSYSALFVQGSITFDAKIDAESCCDKLQVYVDDVHEMSISNPDWVSYTFEFSQGEHLIEWRYTKDGSVDTGEDAAWIDNVSFVAD